MKCVLIQSTRIGNENHGEKAMLDFLCMLPEQYLIYRELKVTPSFKDQAIGLEEKRPDFVVLSPDIGLMSIETKDWDIVGNTYTWQNQYKIQKKTTSGDIQRIDNPMAQADAYLGAFMDLLKDYRSDVFVTSLVAFPRISKSDFLNRIADHSAMSHVQSRFFLDFERVIFKDDLDYAQLSPQSLLIKLARSKSRWRPPSAEEIDRVKDVLLPDKFRVGDISRRMSSRQQVKILSEEQQQWVFDLESKSTQLLDVAGSGKTNALISKALHLVDINKNNPPRILLTTYSQNLTESIRRLFDLKVLPSERAKYRRAIEIQSMSQVMEAIICTGYGLDSIDEYRANYPAISAHHYEAQLRRDVEEILSANPDRFHRFDHVFVDEIQDYDDFYLEILDCLCRTGNFFFVGDIGQKILDRDYNLRLLSVTPDDLNLPKSYKMYRTPRYIAELATRFMLNNSLVKQEFIDYGYTSDFEYPNPLDNSADLRHTDNPVRDVTARISTLLHAGQIEDDMMVIVPESAIDAFRAAFNSKGISFRIGESREPDNRVTLVDFMNVKGLEKPIVFVSGIETLYDCSKSSSLFADSSTRADEERRARRLVYVSITRACEELLIYYRDSGHPLIADLIDINKRILQKRLPNAE